MTIEMQFQYLHLSHPAELVQACANVDYTVNLFRKQSHF